MIKYIWYLLYYIFIILKVFFRIFYRVLVINKNFFKIFFFNLESWSFRVFKS